MEHETPRKAPEGHELWVVMPLLHGELSRTILKCFYEVHHELGVGFPESVYSRAMEIAMTEAGLQVQREVVLRVEFRDRVVGISGLIHW